MLHPTYDQTLHIIVSLDMATEGPIDVADKIYQLLCDDEILEVYFQGHIKNGLPFAFFFIM